MEATPPSSPTLVVRLNNLGVALKHRHRRDGDDHDLARGHAALRRASGPAAAGDTRWALAAALTLAGWNGERDRWDKAAAAYRTALDLASVYTDVQLTQTSTRSALRRLRPLAADAADAFRRAGLPQDAALAVERGRAVLLTRALALDTRAVEQFVAIGPQPLVDRFRDAAGALTALTNRRPLEPPS